MALIMVMGMALVSYVCDVGLLIGHNWLWAVRPGLLLCQIRRSRQQAENGVHSLSQRIRPRASNREPIHVHHEENTRKTKETY